MASTLTDQIGAMSIVDRLRLEGSRVQDYLNTAVHKAVLVEKIQTAYQAEGKAVTRAVIEEGVEQWYSNRLTFNSVSLPWYLLAYIRRERWGRRIRNTLMVAVISVGAPLLANSFWRSYEFQKCEEAIGSALREIETVRLKTTNGNAIGTRYSHAFVIENAASQTRVAQKIEEVKQSIQLEANLMRAQMEQDHVPSRSLLEDQIRGLHALVTSLHSLVVEAITFKGLVDEFQHLVEISDVSLTPALPKLLSETDELLHKPNLSLADATAAVHSTKKKLEAAGSIRNIGAEMALLEESAILTLRSVEDKSRVQATALRIAESVRLLDDPADRDVTQLRTLEMLSRTRLQLLINPNNTGKTAVERRYSQGGGKAWYAIVQAVDDNHTPVKISIKSNETGKDRLTELFAVRITKERYDTLKQDKLEDGIVNDRFVGVKPIGQLDFELTDGAFPEYILEW